MRALLYISLIFILSACSYSGIAATQLDEAQSLLDHEPDKALEKLNGIDVSEIKDSATIARWALLYSEALVANKLHAPSDSIVNIAFDYYASHDLAEEFRRAKAARLSLLTAPLTPADPLTEARFMQKEREYRLFVERARREQYALVAVIILVVTSAIIILAATEPETEKDAERRSHRRSLGAQGAAAHRQHRRFKNAGLANRSA